MFILNMEAIHWRMKKFEQLNQKVNLLTYTFIWPLTSKDETDLDKSPLKMCGYMRYTWKSNMEAIHWRMKKLEQLNQNVNLLTYTFIWPLTSKDEIEFDKSPLKMCGSMRNTCKSNMEAINWRMKKLEQLKQKVNLLTYTFIWPLTSKDETNLDNHHSKCATLSDKHASQIWKQSNEGWRNKNNLTKR